MQVSTCLERLGMKWDKLADVATNGCPKGKMLDFGSGCKIKFVKLLNGNFPSYYEC